MCLAVRGRSTVILLALACAACGGTGAKDPGEKKPNAQITLDAGLDDVESRTFLDCSKGFRVDFPPAANGPVEHETIDEGGVHGEMVSRVGSGVGYSVTWAELPQAMVSEKGATRVLREARDARLGTTGTLDDERTPKLTAGNSIEFAFHRVSNAKDQAAGGRVLLFLRGTTLFQVAALGDRSVIGRADAGAFLSSFQLAQCRR